MLLLSVLPLQQAGAAAKGVPLYQHIANLAGNPRPVLPVPSFNVINGGVHAGNALAPQVNPTPWDSGWMTFYCYYHTFAWADGVTARVG